MNSNIATVTTCYKLQGKTLKDLVINNWNYRKANWVYVVLSRVKKLRGIVLNKKLDKIQKFTCDPQLLRWYLQYFLRANPRLEHNPST